MADQTPSTGGGTEGIDPKLAGLLCYIWIAGIVFLIISKDKFVRFHALQSIFLGVAFIVLFIVLAFILIINWFSWILSPAYLVAIILMMVKAYAGEKYKLPLVGDMAEKNS